MKSVGRDRLRRGTAALAAALLLALAAAGPRGAAAVSYPPLPSREGWSVAPDTGPGGTVLLFPGADGERPAPPRPGDVLVVSRCGPGGEMTPVGRIRLSAFTGRCIGAVVLEGWVRTYDVVTTEGGGVALVVPEIPVCRPAAGP